VMMWLIHCTTVCWGRARAMMWWVLTIAHQQRKSVIASETKTAMFRKSIIGANGRGSGFLCSNKQHNNHNLLLWFYTSIWYERQ
jgi:hypothetical protein